MKVFASCDSIYFEQHAKAFCNSAKLVGLTPHIHIINPTESILDKIKNTNNISYEISDEKNTVYYACNRFYVSPNYIEGEGLLVCDIDCYFNKPFEPPIEDVGLFFREEIRIHAKLAVGIVWYRNNYNGNLFANAAAELVRQEKQVWFADQIGVYKTYEKFKGDMSFFRFTQKYMDWEFTESSIIWTGKGPRKNKNRKYLQRKKYYEEI